MTAINRTPATHASRSGSSLCFVLFFWTVYLVPPLLILFHAIPFGFRFPMLLIVTALVLVYAILRGHSLAALGFRRDTLGTSMRYNLLVTLLVLAAIAALYFGGFIRAPHVPQWRWFFAFYVLLSCPAQEFLFRGVLFAEMDRAGIVGRFAQVALSSVAYCFLHVIYRDALTLGVSLFIGIVWGLGYYARRNFWGVALSHCILGLASIFTGLI